LPKSCANSVASWVPRIAELKRLRDKLTGCIGCIGCGCLSLRACALYNPEDGAAAKGQGARYLLGDEPVGG
jgi:MerR family redox-sensitive transcriptional activator SoxR